jgi:hypothetical protein
MNIQEGIGQIARGAKIHNKKYGQLNRDRIITNMILANQTQRRILWIAKGALNVFAFPSATAATTQPIATKAEINASTPQMYFRFFILDG